MDWLRSFDYTVFRDVNVGLHNQWLDYVFLVLTYTGLAGIEIPCCLILLCWKSTRQYVLPLLLTMFVSGLPVAQGMKHLVERQRPSNLPFAIREEPWLFNSYPSGHTSIAFGSAFTIVLLTWGTPRAKWGYLALVWALLVGVSRIYRGVHWPTDVMAGMFVGMFSASLVWLCMRAYESRVAKDRPL